MLKPLDPVQETDPFFVVADIETYPDGSLICIDTAWRDDGGQIEHILHRSWDEWWEYLCRKAARDSRYRTVFAHNGGGFDWLSLASYLLGEGRDKRELITANCAGSKMVTMTVTRQKKFTFHFCDTLQLLRSSLDKLSEAFLGEGKIDLGGKLPHEILEEDPQLFYQYLERDTECLLRVLESATEMLRREVAPVEGFSHTIGGTAMRVFRTMLDEPITIPWEPNLKEFLRQGYKGGRVEVFKYGHFERVQVFDINSLYPSVMSDTPVPISDRGVWTSEYKPGKTVGLFDVTFRQRNDSIPGVLTNSTEGSIFQGRGTFFTPELDLLLEVDPDAEIEVHKGYAFSDTSVIFLDYVSRLYKLRQEHPDSPISLLAKFLLNSLYGKFGQNPIRETLVTVQDFEQLYELVEGGASIREISSDLNVFGLEKETACAFEHVGIAGIITSAARVRLYRGLMSVGNGLIYCDTDSVHTETGLPDSLVSKRLGDYKKEFEGEGVYCGKKLYALRCGRTGSTKVRAKGVSVGGRNGCRLGFDDLVRILQGAEVECEFFKPPTPMQVFKGARPCRFERRKRTVKKT